MKINMEPIKKFAGQTCKYVAYGVLLTLVGKRYEDIMSYACDDSTSDDTEVFSIGYGGAVKAIMSSDMSSCYKEEVMAALTRGEEPDIYEAVIHIANDPSASSYYKVEMIKHVLEE